MSNLNELASANRTGKFVSVGAFGAVIDLPVSFSLKLSGAFSAEWAKLAGAELAIIAMFFINDRWTFAGYGSMKYFEQLRRLFKSNLVRSIGLGVQFFIVWYMKGLNELMISGIDIWTLLTMPFAILCSFVVNYTVENLFTWKIHAEAN